MHSSGTRVHVVAAILFAGALLNACVTVSGVQDGRLASVAVEQESATASMDLQPPSERSTEIDPELSDPGSSAALSERQNRIVAAARELLATRNFVVNGRRYSYDCTGTILTIYAMAGLDVIDLFPRYSGNGVNRLYSIAREQSLLYHSELPEPGDLIFWDNTYDKNGDTQWNDGLTHVGLVLSIGDDDTIEYLHHHYTQGVVVARMNLKNPETHLGADGVVVNSPMRMRSHRHLNPDAWLSSHLYRELGALHEVEL